MNLETGVQTFFQEAGEAACYAFCIIKIAEEINPSLGKDINPHRLLLDGIRKKFIYYNFDNQNDNNNFFVSDPAGFLSYLTSRFTTVRHGSSDHIPKKGEYVVQRWERKTPKGTSNHFRLKNWDSLVDSQTVLYGAIASTRIFTVI